jgi:hypothetical protein
MKRQLMLFVLVALAGLVVLVVTPSVMPASSKTDMAVTSHDDDDDDDGDIPESIVRRGLRLAPVPLNLRHKNRALVGLGSYLVNAVGDCNGCHSAPPSQFAPGGDPFKGEPKHINQAGYLAGGSPMFGPFIPRNLTPDKTGRPEGGATFQEFRDIMRTGVDPDQAHPGFGPFLQVMPWPAFQDMTNRDLRAIYEYLSAIPCIEGDPGLPHPRPIGTRCH